MALQQSGTALQQSGTALQQFCIKYTTRTLSSVNVTRGYSMTNTPTCLVCVRPSLSCGVVCVPRGRGGGGGEGEGADKALYNV